MRGTKNQAVPVHSKGQSSWTFLFLPILERPVNSACCRPFPVEILYVGKRPESAGHDAARFIGTVSASRRVRSSWVIFLKRTRETAKLASFERVSAQYPELYARWRSDMGDRQGRGAPFFAAMQGKVVSRVARGYGSTLLVEFGNLIGQPHDKNSQAPPHGELSLMIGWSWRIERPQSIQCGSWSEEKMWPRVFASLVGAAVTRVEVFGVLPEISISLSNNKRIVSFMTAEGQPDWALIAKIPNIGSLCVRRGVLCVEAPKS